MCRPQRPEGEEAAEKAPAEAENQGPPDHVAAAVRQPPCHDRGQRQSMVKQEHMIICWLSSCQGGQKKCNLQTPVVGQDGGTSVFHGCVNGRLLSTQLILDPWADGWQCFNKALTVLRCRWTLHLRWKVRGDHRSWSPLWRGVRKQRKLQEGANHEETLTCIYHKAEETIRRWWAEGSSSWRVDWQPAAGVTANGTNANQPQPPNASKRHKTHGTGKWLGFFKTYL